MNIDAVFRQAITEVLSELLAPEKVEQLADAIMVKAKPELEQTIIQFTGFSLGKPTLMKSKMKSSPTPPGESKRGRKKQHAEDPAHHVAMAMNVVEHSPLS